SVTVPFGEEAIAELVSRDIPEERAVRLLSFFFQLRRAFYFIERSLAGECPSMQRLREALWNNVFTHDMRGYEAALWSRMKDFSTLLLGETGTGKGQAATAIAARSSFLTRRTLERTRPSICRGLHRAPPRRTPPTIAALKWNLWLKRAFPGSSGTLSRPHRSRRKACTSCSRSHSGSFPSSCVGAPRPNSIRSSPS